MELINTSTTADPNFYYNYLNNIVANPIVITIVLVVIIVFVLFSYSLGGRQNTEYGGEYSREGSSSNSFFIIVIVAIVIVLIAINAFQYFFSINVVAYVKNLFTDSPEINIVASNNTQDTHTHTNKVSQQQPSNLIQQKQVFNIPGNNYTYENAKALCKAYGASLADYNQVEESYNNGGEWCNYGWSEGQMALYPTQKSTYNHLKKIPGHEHDCGRPGINGGYIANPQVKFGVNCYGDKPDISAEESNLMGTTPRYPQTKDDLLFEEQVNYWKKQLNNILVSPFNNNNWSQI